jgi:hypothetical protein
MALDFWDPQFTGEKPPDTNPQSDGYQSGGSQTALQQYLQSINASSATVQALAAIVQPLTVAWNQVRLPSGYSPWNSVNLGGTVLPGICEVSVRQKRRVQQKKAAGADGSTPTFIGLDPAEVSIRVRLWTAEQFNAFDNLRSVIFPRMNKGQPPALDIVHPLTAHYGIASIIVVSLDGPSPGGATGEFSATLSCVEWAAPKKGAKTVTKTVSAPVAKPFVQTAAEPHANDPKKSPGKTGVAP